MLLKEKNKFREYTTLIWVGINEIVISDMNNLAFF